MAIRVIVKKRPLNRLDGKGDKDVLDIRHRGHVIVHEPKTKVDLTKVVESTEFIFDDAFTEMDTNELIYSRAIRPLVKTALEGGKGSCFAYGQTGSGKVHLLSSTLLISLSLFLSPCRHSP
jgi:chromosomal replication initiation ATPase DnaA